MPHGSGIITRVLHERINLSDEPLERRTASFVLPDDAVMTHKACYQRPI